MAGFADSWTRTKMELTTENNNMSYANPEIRKLKQRDWWARNQERQKEYRVQTKERRSASHKLWRERNPESGAKRQRTYRQKYPGASQVRSRICNALRGNSKFLDTKNLLGCEWDAFCWFLEAQFLPGMTWENYGEIWEIDHITPLSWFDFSNPLDQKQAFHFSNHQPLWVTENRQKGNRYAV